MILLIDNYDSFTWNLVQRLGEIDRSLSIGQDLVVVRNDEVSPNDIATIDAGRPPTHIIISPGPCTPAEAGICPAVINMYMGRVPILGVCLGHQCMAAGNGMTVARHRVAVHGKTSPIYHDNKGIFRDLPNPFIATRYHSLVVLANTIPPLPQGACVDGWEVSAWTHESHSQPPSPPSPPSRPAADAPVANSALPHERVVMGLRRVFASANAAPCEGVQFHPESFLTLDGPKLLANFIAAAPVRP